MNRIKHFLILALALTLSLGAWAQGQLLTTVTATGQTSYSQSPDGIVTVTLNIGFYDDYDYGWLGGTVTVEANQGYTITRCVFKQNTVSIADDLAPFTATLSGNSTDNVSVETSTGHVNGDADHMIGITSIEVYGHAAAPDPTVPALDETTGHWNFLMPGSNKVVKAVLYDSIVVGPHVTVEGLAIEGKYANGTDTVYYYDTNSHSSLNLMAAANDGQGRNFGYWADLDTTDLYYSRRYRHIGSGFTCGDTFRAVYPDLHTLTLAKEGYGTLELDSVTTDTIYTITFYHESSQEGSRTFTIPASLMPYDTTFSYNANIEFAQAYDQMGGSVSMIARGSHTVTVRISGAFEYGGYYQCEFEGGAFDDWSISCKDSIGLVPRHGISKTADNTYSVMEGLTVNVTATPEAGFRLAQWSDQTEPVEGDARLGGSHSYTMPATDATLTATFVQNPLLTLTSNNSEWGTVTLDGITPGATTYDITIEGGNTYTNVSFPFHATVFLHEGLSSVDAGNQDPLIAVKNGDNADITIYGPYGGGRTIMYAYGEGEGGVKSIFCTGVEGLPIMPEGVTYAGINTYSVLPGTQLKVIATPDSAHYFVNWNEAAALNSNTAVEKTLTMGTDDINLTANFEHKPTLTVVCNGNEKGTMELTEVPQETLLTTINSNSTSPQFTSGSRTFDNIATVTFSANVEHSNNDWGWWSYSGNSTMTVSAAEGYTITRVRFFCKQGAADDSQAPFEAILKGGNGSSNNTYMIVGNARGHNGVTKIEVYGYCNSCPPTHLVNVTDSTYLVDYGTTVRATATAKDGYHMDSWSNGAAVTDLLVNSNTVTVTTDSTIRANFIANPLLTLASNGQGTGTVELDGVTYDTVYNITFNHHDSPEGSRSFTVSSLPYDTTFSYDAEVMDAYVDEPSGKLSKIAQGEHTVTIRISGAFEGTGGYGCREDGFDIWSISCTASPVPVYPDGITKTGNNTYRVLPRTEVKVIATPDSAHYFVNWTDSAAVNSNTGDTNTLTMGFDDINLTANFALKPTLTLVHNDGGEMEVMPAGGVTAMHLTTDQIPTWPEVFEPVREADLQPFGFVAVDSAAAAAWTGAPASGQVILVYAPAGDQFKAILFQNGQWYDAYTANFFKGEIYTNSDVVYFTTGVTPSNVIASTEPNTYYIDYNTSVTVKATPSDTTYLVRFDQDADINSNVAVEKTYGPLTAALTTAEATFNDKPVLTLAASDTSWGKVTIEGAASGQVVNANSLQVGDIIKDATGATGTGYISLQAGRYKMGGTLQEVGFSVEVDQFNSWIATDGYTLNFTEGNLTPVDENGQDGNAWIVLGPGSNGPIIGGYIASGTGEPVEKTVTFLPSEFEDVTGAAYQLTKGDITVSVSNGACSTAYNHIRVYKNADFTVSSSNGNIKSVAITCTNMNDLQYGPGNFSGTGYGYDHYNGSWTGNAESMTLTASESQVRITNITVTYDSLPKAASTLPEGVVQLTDSTYRVDYGTTLTVQADATELHHVANWVNEDSILFPADSITYSDYFVTDPVALFPAHSTLRLKVTADTTTEALFGINSYDVTATVFKTADVRGTLSAEYMDIEGATQTAGPDDTLTFSAQGASLTTLVATPEAGYHFVKWTDTTGIVLGTIDTLRVTEAANVVAYFDTTHAELAWDTNVFTGYTFIDFNNWAPTLANPHDVEVRFGCVEGYDPEEGGIVINDSTGVMGVLAANGYVHNMTGTYHIYAVHDLTQEYFYDSVVYTLTVEQGVLVNLLKNNDDFGTVQYPDFGTPHTLTHAYLNRNILAFVAHDTTVTVKATPAEGYHFVNWTVNNRPVATTAEADIMLPNRQMYNLTANFDTNVYTIVAEAQLDDREADQFGFTGSHEPMGTVTVGGNHKHFLTDTLSVEAAYGYTFIGWYDTNDVLVSTENPYTFSPVSDSAFVARFVPDTFALTLVSADSLRGSVQGGGSYPYLTPVAIEADTVPGAYFTRWSDNDSNAKRSVTLTTDSSLTAFFELYFYEVTFGSADSLRGFVTADSATTFHCNYNYVAHFAATANYGYHFEGWNNGQTADSIAVTVTSDTNLVALFGINSYSVTVLSADSVMGSVSGSDTVDYLTEVTLTATPEYGYHFVAWNDGDTANPRSVVVTRDSLFTATFGYNQYVVTALSANDTMGSVSGSDTVDYLAKVTLTATPASCHRFVQWNDGDTNATRTLTVTQDTLFTAQFEYIIRTGEKNQMACDSFVWNGVTYDSTGDYDVVLKTDEGCDSIVTLHLTIKHSSRSVEDVTACESYTWNGVDYIMSTTAYYTTVNEAGCDSTAVLHLTINYPSEGSETVVTCDSQYVWNGITYTTSTIGTWHTTNQYGCDSTVTLYLTLNNDFGSTDSVEACDSYTWIDGVTYTESTGELGAPTYVYHLASGCDSTVTLHLTVNHSSNSEKTVTACDSYLWNGDTLTVSDDYYYSGTTVAGCDSTATLHLTVNHSSSSIDNVVACDSYTWIDGVTYTESTGILGAPTYTTTNVAGCDSIITLHLTLATSGTATDSVVACDSYTWMDSVTYTQSTGTFGAPTYTISGGDCDVVVTLHLTINHSSESVETVEACDSYKWHGQTYTESTGILGAPTYHTLNSVGCDSTVTLHLTVNHSNTGIDDVTACDEYTWIDGVTYTESTGELGAPTFTLTNVEGCDSVVTLHLTLNSSSTAVDDVTACDSYLWHGTTYTASTTLDNAPEFHTTNAAGCDSTTLLLLTLKHSSSSVETVKACDSYTWHGTVYTETPAVAPTFDTVNAEGCDSTVTLDLTLNTTGTEVDSVVACDEYTWIDGVTYTESTGVLDAPTYTLSDGDCDVIVTLQLTLSHSVVDSLTEEACNYYIWDGSYYNASGVYNKSYLAANGCDSTVVLTLTVNQPVATSVYDTACGSYTWNEVNYAASGAYSQTFTAANGCDSTVTLYLTLYQPTTASVTAVACDSYEWNGTVYTQSGIYSYTTTNANGCDSTVTLQLTIATTDSTVDNVMACDEYTWIDGVTYTATPAVAPTYTLSGDNCSTVVTLNLTINSSVQSSLSDSACGYYIWDGSYYNASGVYTKHYETVGGCDSALTLTLTVNQPAATSFSAEACDSYEWNGVTYAASGAYTQSFTTVHGCDSTVTLTLTIKRSSSSETTVRACDSYTWNGTVYTASGDYSYTTTGGNGCDSVATLHLTVNIPVHEAESEVACESFTWNGTVYTASGDYTYSHFDNNGCTQVDTLHLTINNAVNTAATEVACESYTWNGTVYTQSGDYTYSHADGHGCTQVDTLHLTINNAVNTAETEVACGSYTWNGTVYTVSGDYTYSHTDGHGCTQVDTLHLTIGNSVTVEETVDACDVYEWNGRMYTESGVYTYRTTTLYGCDSTVVMTLTVNHSTSSSFDTLVYGSFTWNDSVYTQSGTYRQTLTTVNGCDSVVTLNLVVLPEGFVMPYLYNLMDVMLSLNHYQQGTEGVHYVWYRWYRDDELVLEGPDYDSYSEGGNRLNGCYYVEVAVDENMEYWVRSNSVCINSVGIDDVDDLEISLAPNPVMHGSMVNVSVDGADLQGAEIRVYDLQGRMVLQQKDNGIIEAPQASGMYMVRLTLSDGRTAVKRLIVK